MLVLARQKPQGLRIIITPREMMDRIIRFNSKEQSYRRIETFS